MILLRSENVWQPSSVWAKAYALQFDGIFACVGPGGLALVPVDVWPATEEVVVVLMVVGAFTQ